MLLFGLALLFLLSSLGFSVTDDDRFAVAGALIMCFVCVAAESLI